MLSTALQSLTLAELQAERTACLTALFALAKGERAQRRALDGRMVEYTPGDQARLESLISELDTAIRVKTTGTRARRPIHPVY